MNPVPRVLLDVRIHNGHLLLRLCQTFLHSGSSYQLSPFACKTVSHGNAVWELSSVPREILLAVRVLYVEPHHVHRDIVLVELAVNCSHISLVIVVPPAQGHNYESLEATSTVDATNEKMAIKLFTYYEKTTTKKVLC